MAADLVLFDPNTVGSDMRPERLHDLPGGGKRMVKRSRGIHMTLVNGEITWENGKLTGAAAGQILRTGSSISSTDISPRDVTTPRAAVVIRKPQS
jgi:N-acyl-D-aspartate/D-glutamate deacylase